MPPNFPSQKEREDLMKLLREAEKNGEALSANEHYKNYIVSLRKLNGMMDHYYAADENGTVPPLEQNDKDALMQAILNTANLGETLLADVERQGGKLTTGTPGLVSRMQSMMSKDYETLSLYDPKDMEMTLPEIQQDARTQVIDLRGVAIGRMGNAQSSRLPMTVVDEKGVRRSGVFTKASHVSVLKPFREITDKYAEECGDPALKQQIENIIPGYRDYLQKKNVRLNGVEAKDAADEMIVGKIYQELAAQHPPVPFKKIMKRAGVKDLSNPAVANMFDAMTEQAKEPSFWVNGLELGLKDGDRLDQRNSAMSAVANLLGVSRLVAHSTNMKFLDENGETVEGTFMSRAKGLDLKGQGNERLFTQVSDEPFAQESNLNKDIADLQVLDYICGNIDRHAGNLFYDVDEKTGKIKGLQGIDNDSAFGLFSSGKDGRNFRLKGTDSFTVVSEDMAKKINTISPEMLKFTLRGRGLTEQEIQAACGRLNQVKAALKEPLTRERAKNSNDLMLNKSVKKLSIMSAEDMRKVPLQSFSNDRTQANLFTFIDYGIEKSLKEAREQGYRYDPQKITQKEFREVSTTSRRFTAAGIAESLRSMSRMIRNEVTNFVVTGLSKLFRSSDKWRKMVSSVQKADELSAKLKQEIGENGALDREDPKVRKQLEQADKAMEAVRKATQAYLDKKMKEKKVTNLNDLVGKNDYEKKRIEYAKKVMKNVKEYDRIAKPEKAEEQAEKEAVKSGAELAAKRPRKQKPQNAPLPGQ